MTRPRNPDGLALVAPPDADRTDLVMEHSAGDRQPRNGTAHALEQDAIAAPALTIDPSVDPRDVWMTATDVHDHLGHGRSQGCAFTGSAAFQAVAALPGTWRLADLRAFFDPLCQQVVNGMALDTDALSPQIGRRPVQPVRYDPAEHAGLGLPQRMPTRSSMPSATRGTVKERFSDAGRDRLPRLVTGQRETSVPWERTGAATRWRSRSCRARAAAGRRRTPGSRSRR